MLRALSLLGILALAALAGCAGPAAVDVVPASATPGLAIVEDRPDTSFGDVITGPAVGPDVNATTAAAPYLVRGEWWRIRYSSGIIDEVSEVVRVVADASDEGYVIGMPHEGWYKEAMSYHFPSFGDVNPDLSYDTHNVRFEPLRFPLEQGATWTTHFGAGEMIATVESADEHVAVIRFDPPASDPEPTDAAFAALMPFGDVGTMRLTYDARQHEVVKFESFFINWEVVEHGYGFEGWVTVPRGMHTAIDYGQFLAATPGEPVVMRSTTVDGGFNRLTLMHAIVPLGPGAYRIRATTPNGTEFLTEAIPGKEFVLRFYEANDPDGLWTFEDVVAGPGVTFSMGMAYHQYDIHLPDGAKRSDHSHAVIR